MSKGAEFNVQPCGLGCRDTLRLEAAMPLYGHELNENFLANEVGLDNFIKYEKGDFMGKAALLNNKPKFKRIGLSLIDKGIAREGSDIYDGETKIGHVTSGTHSPTLNHAICMARVDNNFNKNQVLIDVRGRKLLAEVVPLPFYKRSK
jgi:aminomethyltransferase